MTSEAFAIQQMRALVLEKFGAPAPAHRLPPRLDPREYTLDSVMKSALRGGDRDGRG